MSISRADSTLALCAAMVALFSLLFIMGMADQIGLAASLEVGSTQLDPVTLGNPSYGSVDYRPVAPIVRRRAAQPPGGPQVSPPLICYNPITPTWTITCPAVYFPIVVRDWLPFPAIPLLYDPVNPDGDGSYWVIWDSAANAANYQLQEALRNDFVGATQAYFGSETAYLVAGKGPSRYFYRVRGHNSYGYGPWSAPQGVDVVWELEPNNDPLTQANGPIVSGLTYFGVLPDSGDFKDYFYFDLATAGSVELWLTNIAVGNNYELVLRNQSLVPPVAQSTNPGNADEHILTGNLPAARYYVQIVRVAGPGSNQPYHVRVVYP